jgi:hypothetical protein
MISRMKWKSKVTAFLAVVFAFGEGTLQHRDALALPVHIDPEPVVVPRITWVMSAAFAGPKEIALDDGAYMPPPPWRVAETMMAAAAQRMIRLGDDEYLPCAGYL